MKGIGTCSVCGSDAPEDIKGAKHTTLPHAAPCGVPCAGGGWDRDRDGPLNELRRHGGLPPKETALELGAAYMATSWCPKCGYLEMLATSSGN